MNCGCSKGVLFLVLGLGSWLAGLSRTQGAEVWSGLSEGVDNNVFALAHDGTNLYAGGQFLMAGGATALHAAMWNGASWAALGDGMDNDVSALAHDGTRLYAGGSFTTAGGAPASLVAAWDGSSWVELDGGIAGYRVYAMLLHGSRLYVAGDFTNAGGVAVNNVAMWDGTNWNSLGDGIIGGYGVSALAHDGVNLYAGGGYLTNAGGVAINGLARWNGTHWTNLGDGIVGYVSSLVHDGENLYAAGWFSEAGGVPASSIAKWNGSSWSAVGDGLDGMVSALWSDGPYLYAGGSFANAGTVSVTNIAVWTGSAWSSFGGFGGGVGALTRIGTNLFAGGSFTEADGSSASRVATRETLPTYAAITLSQTSMNLRGYYSSDARTGYVVMSNAGNIAFAYQCALHEPGPAFLSWTPTGGTLAAGASLLCTIRVYSASLDVGTYYATNVITAPLATNSPLSVSVRLDVRRGYDPIYFSNTHQAYDGTPKAVTATSLYANAVSLTYDGSTTPPSALGIYAVTGVVDTTSWNSTNRTTLTIARMPQAIVNFLPPADSLFLTNDITHLSADGGGSDNPVVFSLAPGGVGILSGGTNLAFSGPGVVTVYANQAGNAFYDDAPAVAHTFYIYPNIAYVALSGDDANNGRTWAAAKRTIQAGVDIGRPGGAVWVSNGVYNTGGVAMGGATNRVAITNSIAVRSVNGPALTTIAGGDQIRPVGIETGLLAGFTLTNGVVTNAWGGGAWGMGPEAVITNCHINGNQAVSGGGVSGGTVYNCDLLGNYSMDSGGGAIVSHLIQCNITGNRAGRNGGGVRWSTVDSCTIMNNAAIGLSGGGVCEGTANGCLIAGNSAGFFGGASVYTPLNNCTIYANHTGVSAGSLMNCIALGNGIGDVYGLENCHIRNSCLGSVNTHYRDFGVRNGVDGNMIGNPLFMDAANGDFRLQAASPCINAGDNALVPTNLVTDLAGRPRISGGRVDMGAHELTLNEYYVAKNGQTPALPYDAWTNAALSIESAVLASGSKNDRVFHLGQGSYTMPSTIPADHVSGNGDPGHLTLMPTGVVVSSGLSLLGTNQSYVAFRGVRADTQVVSRIALQQVKSSLMARAAKRPIAAGFAYTLAFKTDGSVVGWGRNNYGQIQVPGGSRFIAMAACLDAAAGVDAGGASCFGVMERNCFPCRLRTRVSWMYLAAPTLYTWSA